MMAKMFYTLEETKAQLGKTEEQIKQYSKDGRLREFRDGPRLMFKADQVDQLKNDLESGTTHGDLGPSDSGAGVYLSDATTGASGTGIVSLADTDFGKSAGGGMMKEDTALAQDLGLSGSMGGIPSPGKPTGPGGSFAGQSTGGSRMGITVFDVDDAHRADPSAQTAVGSGITEQVNLEGVGSGSGLLDLTRERDDTSLGAELIDEINRPPVAGGRRSSVVTDISDETDLIPASPINRGPVQPTIVEAYDPLAAAFGALALFGAILFLFVGFVLVNAVFGVHPEFVRNMTTGANPNGMIMLIGAAVGAIVFFVVGWFIGKSGAPR